MNTAITTISKYQIIITFGIQAFMSKISVCIIAFDHQQILYGNRFVAVHQRFDCSKSGGFLAANQLYETSLIAGFL